MIQKLVKQCRKIRWSLPRRGAVPVRWHVGRPNFGDDLNPHLWRTVLGREIRLAPRGAPHVLGMGSILERATPDSVIAGSGFIRPPCSGSVPVCRVLAVRGALSARGMGADCLLGDPAVLVPLVFPRQAGPRIPIGIVPHVTQLRLLRAQAPRGVEVIDVRAPPVEVVGRISRCDCILSQSLHGLIVADGYGVPNAWLAPSDCMIGGRFKFDDYYSTTDRSPEPVRLDPAQWDCPRDWGLSVANYLHDRRHFLEALRDGVLTAVAQM